MKRLLCLAAIATMTVPPASAAMLGQGTQELRISQTYVQRTPAGDDLSARLGYGYFVLDYLVVGAEGSFLDNDGVTTYTVGLFTEYNFDTDTPWVPYVGGAMSAVILDADGNGSASAIELRMDGGIKYYLKDDVALYGELNAAVATDDVFVDGDTLENNNFGIEIGFRIYFGE